MMVLQEIKRRARYIAGPVLGVSLMCYFGYHLVQGDRGLIAWVRLLGELKTAQAQEVVVAGERDALEHRVSLLRREHIDRDMLDEEVRATLNLADPHDIVIMRSSLPD